MAKVLKIAGLVVGAAVLAVATAGTGLALVAGTSLSTALSVGGALVGATFGVGAGTLLLGAAALSTIGTALSNPHVTSSQTDRLVATIDPRAFRKTVLGQTAMATDIRYEEWSGANQEYCDWIVALASHAIDGVEEIWLDQEMAWSQTTGVVAKYSGYFSVPNIVLEGSPANAFSFASGKWNSAARLTGCAYLRLRFKTTGNSKKATSPFSSSIPTRITIIGRGAKLYDPRRDSTVPGGSGPMRWNDQSTWRYTTDDGAVIGENLALQILRVVLGWRIRNPISGEMRLATGSGVPGRRLDLVAFQVAANLCDELVNRSAGGTEPRYHGAGVISEGDDPKQILDMLCAACTGRFRDTGGKLALVIAHNDLAAAAADDGLGDDDVIGGFTWDPDPAIEATPNVVRGRYVDATSASLYQLIDYPEVRLASLDGQDRIMTLDLGVVESPSQAQRIAKQALERRQYQRSFSATFDIRAWKYTVGDPLPFTFAPLAFKRALFRVASQELGQNGSCDMTLSVEHPVIYSWDASDAPPVLAADPIVYDQGNNPLILAIDQAATMATEVVLPGAAVGGSIDGNGDVIGGVKAGEVVGAITAPDGSVILARDTKAALLVATSAIASATAAIAAAQSDITAAQSLIDGINATASDAQAHADQALNAIQGAVADASDAKAAADAAQSRADQAVSQVGGATSAAADAKAAAAAAQSRADQAVSDITAAGGDIVTLKTLTASQASQISSNATAITNTAGNLATLTTTVGAGGNPNLVKNGSFENGFTNWETAGPGWYTGLSGGWGQVASNNTNPADSTFTFLTSDPIRVFASTQYTLASDAALFGSGVARAYLEILWLRGDGSEADHSFGPPKAMQFDFSATGLNRRDLKLTASSPADAVSARVRVTFQKVSGTLSAAATRQVKFEQSAIATPYSADASIVQTFKALSDTTTQYAALSSIVSTQGSSITQNANALSSLGTNVATLTSTVAAQGSSISTNASAISALGTNVASLTSTVTSQGAQISSNASAISSTKGDLATLTTSVTAGSNPNLLKNGSFENGFVGWNIAGAGWNTYVSGGWGQVAGTGVSPADGGYSFISSDSIGIFPGVDYTVAADASLFLDTGTNASVYLEFDWYKSDGTRIGADGGPTKGGQFDFTSTGDNRRALKLTRRAPADASAVRVFFVVYKVSGTVRQATVRQIKLEQGTIATPYSSEASIVQTFKTLNTIDTQYASLSSIVSTQGASITQNASALSSLGTTVATLSSTVSSQSASITTNANAISAVGSDVASLNLTVSAQGASITQNANAVSTLGSSLASLTSTVGTQGSQISSNATAISNVAGNLATLTTSVNASSNPNLLKNGSFENGLVGWGIAGDGWNSYVSGGWGQVAGMGISPPDNGYKYIYSDTIGVFPNAQYTLAADAALFVDSGVSEVYFQIDWYLEDGTTYIRSSNGPGKSGQFDFSTSGDTRRALRMTAQAPANAQRARVLFVAHKISGQMRLASVRQMKFEQGTIATPYSGEASILQTFKALSDASTQYAALSSIVSTQGASITSNASALSSLGTNVANLSSTVSAQGSSISQNASAISTTNSNLASLTSTVSAQGASITQNASAISATNSNLATLTTTVGAVGNPNLVKNGSFENGFTNWETAGQGWYTGLSGGWGQVASNNSNIPDSAYLLLTSDPVPVFPNTPYTLAGDAALFGSGAAQAYLEILWLRGDGSEAGHSFGPPKMMQFDFSSTGSTRRDLKLTTASPGDAVSARVRVTFRKDSGTLTAAAVRQVKFEQSAIATPYSADASIVTSYQAISNLNQSFASLSSTVSTQGASITQNANALSSLGGNYASLSSTVSAQGTSISQNAQAISDTNGRVASLTSTVSAQGVSISQSFQAISTVQGSVNTALARWAIRLDANGRWIGIEANNNGSYGEIDIVADKLKVSDPDGSVGIQIGGGSIRTYHPNGNLATRQGRW